LQARGDFRVGRLLVQAALAAQLEFEMLNGVGDIYEPAIDPGFFERAVEQFASGPDERTPRDVLLVARLLAD
jgi:hypothetical protein